MYYRVLRDTINYTDSSGQEKRASKGTIVRLEHRIFVKNALKKKLIERVPDEQVYMDANLMLQELTEPEAKKRTPPKRTSHTDDRLADQDPTPEEVEMNEFNEAFPPQEEDEDPEPKASAEPEKGDSVLVKEGDDLLTGEVRAVYKDGRLRVQLVDGTLRVFRADAEVEVIS